MIRLIHKKVSYARCFQKIKTTDAAESVAYVVLICYVERKLLPFRKSVFTLSHLNLRYLATSTDDVDARGLCGVGCGTGASDGV